MREKASLKWRVTTPVSDDGRKGAIPLTSVRLTSNIHGNFRTFSLPSAEKLHTLGHNFGGRALDPGESCTSSEEARTTCADGGG